jgi:hypothetical protein
MTADPANLPSSLNTMTGRIRQILLNVPQARSSDKVLLITYLRQYGPFCYDETTKKLTFKDKEGIDYETWLKMPSTESICRIKRDIQMGAKISIKAGLGTELDVAMLPSAKVAEQREILQSINRKYFYRD